jgi:hypothetical protein
MLLGRLGMSFMRFLAVGDACTVTHPSDAWLAEYGLARIHTSCTRGKYPGTTISSRDCLVHRTFSEYKPPNLTIPGWLKAFNSQKGHLNGLFSLTTIKP